jgi:multicomponent Na+:H+ antiporter subunit G
MVHVAIAILALLITNPTGAHAIARAAHRSGVLPKMAVIDRLAEDEKKKGGVSA